MDESEDYLLSEDAFDLVVQDGPDLFDLVDEPVVAQPPAAPDQPPAAAKPAKATADVRPEAPLALYRRYRPDTFADVIGQEHVTEPLQRALVNNRVGHAYLFSGPRGCGKTTSARILARALNCAQGPTAVPCGACQSCRDLARGGPGSIDVIEIDAASHGGVDQARDLRERAFFAPVNSRYKIYIIDEAHMVTKEGFNALLKVVEEPPAHVKFIFATTEPDKVLPTIRSRTHHYPFRLVPPKVLSGYLAALCKAEGMGVEPSALSLVVRAGAGSVRDSLSVLDQLLGGAGETGVTYRQAAALLGYTPDALLDEITDAFAAGDGAAVFATIDKVIEAGQDPRRFAEDLLRRLRDLIVVSAVPDALSSGLVDVADDQAQRMTTQARTLGTGELTRAADIVAKGLTEMRGTTAPRLHLELMCARILLPGADVDERGIHARLDRLERRLAVASSSVPAAVAEQVSRSATSNTRPPGVVAEAMSVAQPSSRPAVVEEPAVRAVAEIREQPTKAAAVDAATPAHAAAVDTSTPAHAAAVDMASPAHAAAAPAPSAAPVSVGELSAVDLRNAWPGILTAVKAGHRLTWAVLSQHGHVVEFRNGQLTLGMTSPGARDTFLSRRSHEDALREAILDQLGLAVTVEVILTGGAAEPAAAPSPAARQPAARPEASTARRDAVAAARENIRPTRRGSAPAAPEEAPSRDDVTLDDTGIGLDELLTRHLGAALIAEDDPAQ